MKKLLLTVGCLVAGVTMARQQTLALLPPPTHADTEVSTNVPCQIDAPSIKEARLEFALHGTPSNNVESTIGPDRNGDGKLSFDEEGITVEWVCGEFFVRGIGGEIIGNCETGTVSFVTYGPDTNGFMTAVLTIPIRRHKANPDWFYDPTWNMVRVTKRGIDEPMERVTVATKVAGFQIIVR